MGLAESGRRVEILPRRARRPGRANVWSPILGRNPTWAPRGDRTATSGSVLSYPWGHPWPPWAARVGGVLWPGQCSLLEALPLSTQGHGLGWTHPLPLRVAVATARRTVLGRVAGSRNTGLQERRKPRQNRGSRSTATRIRRCLFIHAPSGFDICIILPRMAADRKLGLPRAGSQLRSGAIAASWGRPTGFRRPSPHPRP